MSVRFPLLAVSVTEFVRKGTSLAPRGQHSGVTPSSTLPRLPARAEQSVWNGVLQSDRNRVVQYMRRRLFFRSGGLRIATDTNRTHTSDPCASLVILAAKCHGGYPSNKVAKMHRPLEPTLAKTR